MRENETPTFMRIMVVLWLIVWCGFVPERSPLLPLMMKRKRVTAASRKKISAVHTRI
jgi:hypothetical protein